MYKNSIPSVTQENYKHTEMTGIQHTDKFMSNKIMNEIPSK